MLHEIGHYLLDEVLGLSTEQAVQTSEVLEEWRQAVSATVAVRWLTQEQRQAQEALAGQRTSAHSMQRLLFVLTNAIYDSRETELFARSYAQFVAEQSGSAAAVEELEASLARLGASQVYLRPQWVAADFAPVRKALAALFREQGWMRL